jgi:hypothetical protein
MMTKQTSFSKDLTKKDLIKILRKIDSERTTEILKDYSFMEEVSDEELFRSETGKFLKTCRMSGKVLMHSEKTMKHGR